MWQQRSLSFNNFLKKYFPGKKERENWRGKLNYIILISLDFEVGGEGMTVYSLLIATEIYSAPPKSNLPFCFKFAFLKFKRIHVCDKNGWYTPIKMYFSVVLLSIFLTSLALSRLKQKRISIIIFQSTVLKKGKASYNKDKKKPRLPFLHLDDIIAILLLMKDQTEYLQTYKCLLSILPWQNLIKFCLN